MPAPRPRADALRSCSRTSSPGLSCGARRLSRTSVRTQVRVTIEYDGGPPLVDAVVVSSHTARRSDETMREDIIEKIIARVSPADDRQKTKSCDRPAASSSADPLETPGDRPQDLVDTLRGSGAPGRRFFARTRQGRRSACYMARYSPRRGRAGIRSARCAARVLDWRGRSGVVMVHTEWTGRIDESASRTCAPTSSDAPGSLRAPSASDLQETPGWAFRPLEPEFTWSGPTRPRRSVRTPVLKPAGSRLGDVGKPP